MRFIFNLERCGAANNGGTKTIFASANTLVDMGHEVFVVSDIENKFTWFPLKAEFIHFRGKSKEYPSADAHIATGFQTVKPVLASPSFTGERVHWIRAHETWIMKDPTLVYHAPTRKLVNSKGLQQFIKANYGIDSIILYPGIEYDVFRNVGKYDISYPIGIGALYNQKARKRFPWVVDSFRFLKRTYGRAVRFILFGNDGRPINLEKLFRFSYVQQPAQEQLVHLYNQCTFWLAPTESEGLHICPMEAALCRSVVIGTDAPLAGMSDWLDETTGFVSENDYDSYLKMVLFAFEQEPSKLAALSIAARDRIVQKIGSRRRNMGKLVHLIKFWRNER